MGLKQLKPLVLCGPAARLTGLTANLWAYRLPFRVLPAKAAVGSRPPTQDKQKTGKSKALLFCFYNEK